MLLFVVVDENECTLVDQNLVSDRIPGLEATNVLVSFNDA